MVISILISATLKLCLKAQFKEMHRPNLSIVLYVFGWVSATDHAVRQKKKKVFAQLVKWMCVTEIFRILFLKTMLLINRCRSSEILNFCFYNDFISCFLYFCWKLSFSDLLTISHLTNQIRGRSDLTLYNWKHHCAWKKHTKRVFYEL